ncbi:MAG TPA: ABC transporter permease, partial [Emticicia sp.]
MIRNYLKIALRNLWKSKGYTTINIVGLSVAFTIAVFLFLTAYFLITFDSFHKDKDRIFQTYIFSNDPEKVSNNGGMPIPLAPILKAEYPEIEGAARIFQGRKILVEYKGKYFDENICMTDPDFLNIFSFPMIKGNRKTSLNDLDDIVISEKMAKAVFGKDEPIGKQIQVGNGDNKKPYIVSGLISDNPSNSTIRYDALIRIENMSSYAQDKDNWGAYNHSVFIKLNPKENQETFEKRIRTFAPKYFPQGLSELKNKGAKADPKGDILALRLLKLTDLHFDMEITGKGTPIAVVYTLIGIAVFILFIACINFINLNIARSFSRAKEIGVRKSLGALKNQLFFQIWGESIIICLSGFLLGIMLAYSLLPKFNAVFDAKIDLGFLIQPGFILIMVSVFIIVTFMAGGYPAMKMTKFNAIEVLKGKVSVKGSSGLRNSLIITQFSMSTLLICCTVIAFQQINYLRTRPLGFEKEEVISIPVGNVVNGQQALQRMRNKLANDPTIVSISGSGLNLGKGKDRVTARSVVGLEYKGRQVSTDWVSIDYDYLKTLNIKLLAGREFNPAYASDSLDRVIITESMAKALGEKDPVGKTFRSGEE